ncbi:tail sheath protein [Bacillus phage vB_BceM-HSE3]|nr:tail sheath protein [Bacillus phage vB_BceM-HSE3]
MTIYLSPGVPIRERSYSSYISQLASPIQGMVGTATRGPLNTPTLITSRTQFIDTFGEPHTYDFGALAAVQFLEKGNQLYYTRIAGSSVSTAGAIVKDAFDSSAILKIRAVTPGSALNGLQVHITDVNIDEFKLTVIFKNQIVEIIECSTNPESDNYVEKIVRSRYIRIDDSTDGKLIPPPKVKAGVYVLDGGHDGIIARPTSDPIYASYKVTDIQGTDAVLFKFVAGGKAGNDYSIQIKGVVGSSFNLDILKNQESPSQAVVKDQDGAKIFTVSTIEVGETAPVYKVEVVVAENSPLFDLIIKKSEDDTELEKLEGLSTDPLNPNYYLLKVTEGSKVKITAIANTRVVLKSQSITMEKGTKYTAVEQWTNLSASPEVPNFVDKRLVRSLFLNSIYLQSRPSALKEGIYKLEGGTDGSETNVRGVGIDEVIGTGNQGLQAYTNPDDIDLHILTAPGWNDPVVLNEILKISEQRGDCIGVFDTPFGLSPQQVVDWHNGAGVFSTHQKFSSSYGAMYWSWIKVYDQFSRKERWVPPTGVVTAQYAYNDTNGEPWFAPAGLNRGKVSSVLEIEHSPSREERDLLYSGKNSINPIVNFKGEGVVIYGDRTLERNDGFTSRVSVRRLVLNIRKAVAASTAYFNFEQNDYATWARWKGMIAPYLQSVKARRGLYGFSVIMNESTVTQWHIENHQMPGTIVLYPTQAAEVIPIDFVLTSNGAVFNPTNDQGIELR